MKRTKAPGEGESHVACNERIKAEIRAGMLILQGYQYGWGPHHDGVPLRPDVIVFVHEYLCRVANAPFDFGGAWAPELMMDERGSVVMSWVDLKRRRVLELFIPCHGVVISRQRFDGSETFIEGRLATDHDELTEQLAGLREWIGGVR